MTPHELLDVYHLGCFPMAKSRDDDGFAFYAPHTRALLPIKDLHIPKRLKRKMQHISYEIKMDTAFDAVIRACADARQETWINESIIGLFNDLHRLGVAHSIEYWSHGVLNGGLYGLALGSTFCGESMFSRENDASKIALVHLCRHLESRGFKLLDSQFRNPHLDQFGLYEMPQEDYVAMMQAGLNDKVSF